MDILLIGLVVGSVLVGLMGIVLASQATVGAVMVGFACLLGILARIAQASEYRRHPDPPLSPAEEIARRDAARLAAMGQRAQEDTHAHS